MQIVQLILRVSLIAALAGPIPAAAAQVLYCVDYVVGTDQLGAALEASSHTVTKVSDIGGACETQIATGSYALVVVAIQNTGYSTPNLNAWMQAGKPAILQDWTLDATRGAAAGVTFTGTTNQTAVTVTNASLAAGLTNNPFTLANTGWGTFSTGMSAASGSVVAATFGNGHGAIVLGRGGKVITNGWLTDTIDAANGRRLYANELKLLLGNSTPVAASQSLTTPEDSVSGFMLQATDGDGDALTYRVVTGPQQGTLTGTGPAMVYTPAANFHGADSFTFVARDGTADSAPATVSITVTPVNDAPVAQAQAVTTGEDAAIAITLTGTDADGDTLTFTVVGPPSHGAVAADGADLVYTPAADFHGDDAFTFRVNDGAADSAEATVAITVASVNDAPIAHPQGVTTDEDAAVMVTLGASDVDGDGVAFTLVSMPQHGTLSGTVPDLTYTPGSNYHGSDSFTFEVSDGQAVSATATISVTVLSVNDAPVAAAQALATDEDTAVALTLSGSDVEGSALAFALVAQPQHGSLSGIPPDLVYTPGADFHGADAFTFKVSDGQVDSAVQTVSVQVAAVNDAPLALAASVTTPEDTPVQLTLSGTDVEGDPLTYVVVTPPAHGTLGGELPNLTYTPDANHYGADAFTFKVTDGAADSAPATLAIDVGPVNDAPVAEATAQQTDEDVAVAVTLQATDPDGDALAYTLVALPQHGTLSGTPPNLTYTPDANYAGPDGLSFRVSDGQEDSNVETVTLSVASVDDAPVASPQEVTLTEDLATAIQLHGTDVEGAPLTFRVVTPPAHGALSGEPPALVYRPDHDYEGTDSFTFVVTAEGVDSAPATVTITVSPSVDALAGGGVGCSSSGGGLLPAWLLLGAVLLALRRRPALLRTGPALLGVLGILATSSVARAQSLPVLEAGALQLDPGASRGLVVGGGALLDAGALRVSLSGQHEQDPLLYFRDGERVGAIIGRRTTAHLTVAWAPVSWLQVGGELPLIASQAGDDLSSHGLATPAGTTLGTTRLAVRASPWQQRTGSAVDVSVGLGVQLPLGGPGSLAGEAGIGLTPHVGVGRDLTSWLGVGGELAVALQPQTTFDGAALDRSAVHGAVVLHTLGTGLRGELSWRGAVPLGGGPLGGELLAGLRLPVAGSVELYGLGGLGLGRAVGVPTYRLLAGVSVNLGARRPPVSAPRVVADPEPQPEPAPAPVETPVVAAVVPEQPPEPPAVEPTPPAPTEDPAAARAKLEAQIAGELAGVDMFEPGSAELLPAAVPVFARVAALLATAEPQARVSVEGHTDDSGSGDTNTALSIKRAQTVGEILVGHGVAKDRVETQGFGASRPLGPNDTAEGRAANRRVEVRIRD